MSIKNIKDNLKSVKNKRILLRLDLNEEVDSKGKLLDDFRIQAVLPTIRSLQSQGAKLVIVSHLGRPDGKPDAKLSLEPIAKCLAHCLNYKFVKTDSKLPEYDVEHVILFTGDIREKDVREVLENHTSKDIILLENIRFYPEEEKNSKVFAKQLSELADVFISDAFGVSHRKDSSLVGITEYLPSYAGPLLSKELKAMDYLLSPKVKKPFVLLMGGIKIADKAKTLANLGKRADKILLAGGLANLFLHAQGYDVGHHQIDKESVRYANQLLLNLKSKLVIPKDVVVYSPTKGTGNKIRVKKLSEIVDTDKIYDIGPETILEFSKVLQTAGTVCWNGPLGYFEEKPFRAGTLSISKVIGGIGKRKAYVLAGGGETVASIRLSGQFEHFDHVSTGGGAMLSYLAGDPLPAVEALKN